MSSPPQESPASSADETRQHATASATPGLFHEARNQQEAHPQGRQLNVIGRRGTLIASSLWFMAGWTCLAVATPKAALFVGRLLTGIGTGIAALTVSVFISEISPANLRGQLNTGANLILCSGILTVFVLGKFLSFWLLAACCLIPAAAMSVALFWCHESPRWLLKNNQRRSAVAALRFYFGPGAASELATLEAALSRMHGTAGFSLPDLTSRRVYRAFLCVLLIMSMQQLSGISVIITFTQDIFEDAGTTVSPEDAAIILAFIQVVMVGVATVLADRVGRKILLMFSTTVSSVCLGALGMSFNLKASVGDSFKETYGWLPLTSLGLFFVGYSVGLGPWPWTISTMTTPYAFYGVLLLLALGSCSAQQLGILTNPLGSLTNTGSRLNPVNLGTRAWDQTFGKITNTSASDISKQLTENAIPGVRHRVITDVPLGGHVLAEIFQNSSGNVIDCNLLGDKALIEGVLVVLPESLVTKVTPEEMNEFLELCGTRENFASKQKSAFDYIGDIFKSLFIFPGTKWCGAGNVAKNYDDLGPSRATDACCREHDHSEDNIPAFQSKHGIRNTNLYTMTHCKGDRKFYGCLLNDSSVPSFTVGKIFFNILRTNCFDYTFPKKCVQNNAFYIPLITEKCSEYRLDPAEPKEWQTFKPPNFYKDYLARKKQQSGQGKPVSPATPGQEGGTVSVTTEEPEEEPEEEPIEDAEPDNWKKLDPADYSLDATEEPVFEETTPRPAASRSSGSRPTGLNLGGFNVG